MSGRVGDQDQIHTGGVDHVLHTVGGGVGAERHILAARGHDGVDGNDHLHAAVDAYADCDVRSDAERDQLTRKGIDAGTKLGVRDTTPLEPQRRRLG